MALTGTYTERNLQSYYAGTNLPNLFRLDEKDRHRAFGGNLALGSADAVEVTLDYRQTKRETYGIANRYGADVRWAVPDTTFKAGGGLHRVSAADAPIPGTTPPTLYGLSRNEVRAWVMYLGKGYNASLDGIIYHFDDDTNPNLNGKSSLAQLVASLGVNPTANLSVSGDLSVGTNAYYQREVSALLRTTYRFGASKGEQVMIRKAVFLFLSAALGLGLTVGCGLVAPNRGFAPHPPPGTGPRPAPCSVCHADAQLEGARQTLLRLRPHLRVRQGPPFPGRAGLERVAACHAPSFCADCHSGKTVMTPGRKLGNRPDRESPHRADYLTVHRFDGADRSHQLLQVPRTVQQPAMHHLPPVGR